jgi:hypothetical protein
MPFPEIAVSSSSLCARMIVRSMASAAVLMTTTWPP